MHLYNSLAVPRFTSSRPLGTWSVAGYRDLHLHVRVAEIAGEESDPRGGSQVQLTIYFDNLQAFDNRIWMASGRVPGGGWTIFTRVYQVFAPSVSIVFYNPTVPMTADVRLYAGCCPDRQPWLLQAFGIQAADAPRMISHDVPAFDSSWQPPLLPAADALTES